MKELVSMLEGLGEMLIFLASLGVGLILLFKGFMWFFYLLNPKYK